LSNQPAENAVIVFHRSAHRTLEPRGSFPTGGAGFGSGSIECRKALKWLRSHCQ